MDEERPSPTTYTPITSPEEQPGLAETQQMESPKERQKVNNPSTLLMLGFLLVIVLIVVGLFLPPISLGDRLGLSGNGDEAGSTAARTETSSADSSAPGGERLGEESVEAISFETFSTREEWSAAATAIPANMTPVGSIYLVQPSQVVAAGQVALDLPANSGSPDELDLVGWDGQQWRFVQSQLDVSSLQLVTAGAQVPQALFVARSSPPDEPAIAAEVLPTHSLPDEFLPYLTEISVGTLALAENGGLQGEVTSMPSGPYDQFIRVTNAGAIVDQASLASLLNDSAAQADQINVLVGQVVTGAYAGVNLDYQGVPPEQAAAFTSYVGTLAEALHEQGRHLAVTLATPMDLGNDWDTGGQDWPAIGGIADAVYIQMPLDPTAYGDGGLAEQLLRWAIRRISRERITLLFSASAVDRVGESFVGLTNDQALVNFGELQFVQGGAEIDPGTNIEVALSGTATPLEWDGDSLTYKYSYELSGQTHHIWLGSEAALSHKLRYAQTFNVRGVAVRDLANLSNDAGYVAALSSYLGLGDAPQPVGAAIVWTVKNVEGSVLASSSGDTLSFSWAGSEDPGDYSVNADFALGENIASLGSLTVSVMSEEPLAEAEAGAEDVTSEPEAEEAESTEPSATSTPLPVITPGDADAVVNVGANVRVGPGLGYSTIAGGLNAGDKVTLLGRNSSTTWLHILLPDGERTGWIFASLLNINQSVDVSALEVIEVEPPVVAGGGDSGGAGAPPPVSVPPVTNSGFELGGQTHSLANPALMSYAGMNWVKFQHKWSAGQSPDVVAGRIQQAHANGFKVLLSIPGAEPTNIDFNAYTSFLGGVAALGPDAIEVWNEMNIDREWPSGQISPSSYVNSMLAPAYNAIKAARSSVMVISGAPAPTGFFGGCGGGGCDDNLYVAGMASAGAARYMDCIGIHYNEGIISPNQTSGDPRNPSNHYTRYFWGMVNAYWNAFGGSRPLCFTELGYLSGADYGGLPAGFTWAGNTSVAQHAQWLAEAASLSASSGKVRMMIVFNVDFTTYGADPQAGYAMIRANGSCPACESLRQVMGGG